MTRLLQPSGRYGPRRKPHRTEAEAAPDQALVQLLPLRYSVDLRGWTAGPPAAQGVPRIPDNPYRDGPEMTHDELHQSGPPLDGGQGLKNALHHVFDGQIPNFGAYNLVFADRVEHDTQNAPPRMEENVALATTAFVVGYRWRPTELMIAPVHLGAITAAGVPAEVNMTNLAHALQWDEDGSYEVGTSTGRIFRFDVRADHVLDIGPGTPLGLTQHEDHVDFTAFMEAFIALA